MIPAKSECEMSMDSADLVLKSAQETAGKYGSLEYEFMPETREYRVVIRDRGTQSVLTESRGHSALLAIRDVIEAAHAKLRPNEPLYAD